MRIGNAGLGKKRINFKVWIRKRGYVLGVQKLNLDLTQIVRLVYNSL